MAAQEADVKEIFATAVQTASGCVAIIEERHLSNPTPCTEWDLRTLLNHMTNELLWVPDMLAGKTVSEVGGAYDGDVLGENFHEAWKQAAAAATSAVKRARLDGTVHASFGNITAQEYIIQVAGDIYIHTWDVDQAEHSTMVMDEVLAQTLYDYYAPQAESFRGMGIIGPEVPVPADARPSVRLLGVMGRRAPAAS